MKTSKIVEQITINLKTPENKIKKASETWDKIISPL